MGEAGERRAREGREWERSELYMYIIVYYTYAFVYMASEIGRGRREASEIGRGRETNCICIYVK